MSTDNSRRHSAPLFLFLPFCLSLYGWWSARVSAGDTGPRVLVLPANAQRTAAQRVNAPYAPVQAAPDEGDLPKNVSVWNGTSRSRSRRPKRLLARTFAQPRWSSGGAVGTTPFPTEAWQTEGRRAPGGFAPEEEGEEMTWVPSMAPEYQVPASVQRPRKQWLWASAAPKLHPYVAGQQQKVGATEVLPEENNATAVAVARRGYPGARQGPARTADFKALLNQYKVTLYAVLGGVLVATLLGGIAGARYARKKQPKDSLSSAWQMLFNPEKVEGTTAKAGKTRGEDVKDAAAQSEHAAVRLAFRLLPLVVVLLVPQVAVVYFLYMYIRGLLTGERLPLDFELIASDAVNWMATRGFVR